MFNHLVVLTFIWLIVGSNVLNAQQGRFQKVVIKGGLIVTVDAENVIADIKLSDTLEMISYRTNNTFNEVDVYNHKFRIRGNAQIEKDSISYKRLTEYAQKDYNTCDSNLIVEPYEVIKKGKFDKKYPFVDIHYITKYPNADFYRNITEKYEFRYTVYYKRFMYVNGIVYAMRVSSNNIELNINTNEGNRKAKCAFRRLLRGISVGGCIISPRLKKIMTQDRSSCSAQKKVLEQYFYWNDYKKTIDLLKKYEPCYKDKKKYNLKLGLLYHKTHQKDLAKLHCEKYLEELSGDKRISTDVFNCKKANVYLLLGLEKEMRAALKNVREDKLGKKEKEMFNYMNSIESISSIGFEIESLFD